MTENIFRMILLFAVVTGVALSQTTSVDKQVAAPLPRVSLKSTSVVVKDRVFYNRVSISVLNAAKLPAEIFSKGAGKLLPPNPCSDIPTRAAYIVYSDRGVALTSCIGVEAKDQLSEVAFLIRKGKAVPPYVYIVLLDLNTGAAYRSNMVSPYGGTTK